MHRVCAVGQPPVLHEIYAREDGQVVLPGALACEHHRPAGQPSRKNGRREREMKQINTAG